MTMKLELKKDRLWREMKESRQRFLTGLRMWPEERLHAPVTAEDGRVREMVAASAVAESRILTAVQQIWNGDPVSVPLGADALERDRKEVERRMKWRWPEILDEIFWFREETNSTMTRLKDSDLARTAETAAGVVTVEDLLRSIMRRDDYHTRMLASMVLERVHRFDREHGLGTAWLVRCCW